MVTVDESKCGGCGRCIAFCPREALSVVARWGHLDIDADRCTDCFGGVHQFEQDVSVVAYQFLLDHNRIIWPRLCIENCPVSALSVAETPNS